jgi:hypothetical protein
MGKPHRDPDDSKLREDANEAAFRTLQEAIGGRPKTIPGQLGEKNPEAVKRGRKGGTKGGQARRRVLTKQERTAIARRAAKARWEMEGK